MKFVCDSCHAQYMISDDKVGPNGVKVRCKKCSNVIVVKKMAEPDPTQVMQNPLATDAGQQPKGADGMFGGIDLDEIGQAFDSVLSSPGLGGKTDATKTPDSSDETTQAGNMPMAAAGAGDPNGDRESTTVMNLKDLTALAAKTEERTSVSALPDGLKAAAVLEQQKKNEVNGHANGVNGANGKTNGAASGEVPQTDWYIAIDDEQKGPVTLDFVKKAWEEGKVSTDSLVWRNGYGDWRPLSTVPDLVKVLTPIPVPRKSAVPASKQTDDEKPAGATATGSQTPWSPGSSPEPTKAPAVPDPDEVDWKPAAASALASLVQEEMAALTKPTPKKTDEPVGVGEGTRPRSKGLLDMPEEPVASKSALADEPAAPKGALDSIPSLPSMPAAEEKPEPRLAEQRGRPAPTARPEPASQPSVEIPVVKPNLPAARPPVDSQRMEVPVYPPPATYVPPAPPPAPSNAKYVVIGGGVLAVCLTIVVVAWMFKTPAPVQPAQPQQPVQVADNRQPPPQPTLAQPAQPIAHPQPVAQPAQPVAQPAQPVAQPAQPIAAQPVAQPAQPVAQPAQPVAQPAQPVAQPAQPAVKAAPAEEEEDEAPAKGGHKKKHKKKHEGEVAEAAPKQPEAPAKQPEAASSGDADPLAGTKHSKVDDDFDKLLGGNGGKAEEKKPEKKKDVYIPAAIDNLPAQLGKGDIMGVVASHKDSIVGCVKKQKAADADASGTLVMHWQIEKSGSVSGVKCNSDEFKSTAMAKCMASEIKGWKFGQFSGNAMPIDFPFKF